MAWRDLADQLDQASVETFDYGGVSLQKMAAGVPVGDPIPLPAEFDGAFVTLDMGDGTQASTVGTAVMIHYGHLPDGITLAVNDRFILADGPAAGTYVIDDLQPNDDRTGAAVKLKRQLKT
jgi:hypothetical protein